MRPVTVCRGHLRRTTQQAILETALRFEHAVQVGHLRFHRLPGGAGRG